MAAAQLTDKFVQLSLKDADVHENNHNVVPSLVRSASIGPDWCETFLDHEQAGACSLAISVANGHSILQISLLATSSESHGLKVEAIAAADKRMNGDPELSRQTEQRIVALRAAYLKADQPWRTMSALINRDQCKDRLPLYAIPAAGAALCDALLLRALSIVDGQIDGHIDQIGQLLLLRQSSADAKKYAATEKWANQLAALQQTILTKLA